MKLIKNIIILLFVEVQWSILNNQIENFRLALIKSNIHHQLAKSLSWGLHKLVSILLYKLSNFSGLKKSNFFNLSFKSENLKPHSAQHQFVFIIFK